MKWGGRKLAESSRRRRRNQPVSAGRQRAGEARSLPRVWHREAFDFNGVFGYSYQFPAIGAGHFAQGWRDFYVTAWRFLKDITMYAVIKTGGKQYRVANGEKLKVEQIPADIGQEIILDQVLMVGEGSEVKVGAPLVAGASVTVKVVSHGRADKVKIFKLRRRKHYQKHQGHRQNYTEIQVSAINA